MVEGKDKPAGELEDGGGRVHRLFGTLGKDVVAAMLAGGIAAAVVGIVMGVLGVAVQWDELPAGTGIASAGAVKLFLKVLRDGQTLLAGVFGFVGLFGVANLNARHVLERDKANLNRQRRSLAAALQAEIAYLGTVCENKTRYIAEVLSAEGKETARAPEDRRDEFKVGGMTIYEANGARIGNLPPDAGELVVGFYTLLAAYNTSVSGGLIGRNRQRDMKHAGEATEAVVQVLQVVIDGKFDS